MFPSLELQAFPATPVGDLFLVHFPFPLQIYKECKNNGTKSTYFLCKYLCKRLHRYEYQKVRKYGS